jgi:S-adenosylmethionine:tRNA ribosyltransferase-isomerase
VDTSELDYELPEAAVAQHPAEPRDAARLFVPILDGADRHRHVSDLPSLVEPGTVVVLNDTRVLPARVAVRRPGSSDGEVLLLEAASDGWWEALCRPSRKLREGSVVHAVVGDLAFELGATLDDGRRMVRPVHQGDLLAALDVSGVVPLPPYVHERLDDPERYQTVFARVPGSVAAPTAGLHLTPAVLDRLRDVGAELHRVELVVGLDTFRPISTTRVEDHVIHSEQYTVPPSTWDAVTAARDDGRPVLAVGTTTVRSLESMAATGAPSGRTSLFITPGDRFAVVDRLLTNFHLPRSSLLALIEAFTGPVWRDLYGEALAAGYRFLSFGDAMLLDRAEVEVDATATRSVEEEPA